MRVSFFSALLMSSIFAVAQQTQTTPDTKVLFEHAKAATVVVLSGEGAGRFRSVGTGVVVSKDGIILTALHTVKGAAEVQVRLPGGDVFDHVELLGIDERRDVAALKISAGDLPILAVGSTVGLSQGDRVYAVTNSNGLTWSATEGILSAVRPADEIPGAGNGYRLLQFTAPVSPGTSGGALLDKSGSLLGIITLGNGNAAFAVPIESVLGLSSSGEHVRLGSGSALQMPAKSAAEIPQSSAAIAGVKPAQLLRTAKTIYLQSKTSFLTVDTLDRALRLQKDWEGLGLTVVQDPRVSDVSIQIDRPIFTYVHTFVIVDKKTSIVLGSGKVTAFDGTIASSGLAKDIVKIFMNARSSVAPNK